MMSELTTDLNEKVNSIQSRINRLSTELEFANKIGLYPKATDQVVYNNEVDKLELYNILFRISEKLDKLER